MHNSTAQNIIIIVIVSSFLILLLILFITWIIYLYEQKQNDYLKNIENIKAVHSTTLLQSQVEMQEQTFKNISREMHDNIGQKLTLAKLQLNTLHYNSLEQVAKDVNDVVYIIGKAITDLSDISRSLSHEIILQKGLIKGLEFEVSQIEKSGEYKINLDVTGNAIFLESDKELVLFRLTQEALHNIIKHAEATSIQVSLHYASDLVQLEIKDDGRGFEMDKNYTSGTGMRNMQQRVQLLNGSCVVDSNLNQGTHVTFSIPFI